MDLDEYVKLTLLSIAKGVRAAQSDAEDGGVVGRVRDKDHDNVDAEANFVTQVQFDVATTVSEVESKGASGSIKVLAIGGVDAKGGREAGREVVSRVAFSVPLGIPMPGQQREELEKQREERRRADRRDTARIQGTGSWAGV